MFYLGGSYSLRKLCYFQKGFKVDNKFKFVSRDNFAKESMAWASVCNNGNCGFSIRVYTDC